MPATLSVLGLYKWDDSIFDDLTPPESVDKQTLVNMILLNTAQLESLYTQPETLKMAIGLWSAVHRYEWLELEKTTKYDYNAINNYDRKETRTVTRTGTDTDTGTVINAGTTNISDDSSVSTIQQTTTNQQTIETPTGDLTETIYKAGFDAVSPLINEKRETHRGTNIVTTLTGAGESNKVDTATESGYNSETGTTNTETRDLTKEKEESETEESYIRGNIGVTTTQAMIQAQRDIVRFSLYDVILSQFRAEFCLLIY